MIKYNEHSKQFAEIAADDFVYEIFTHGLTRLEDTHLQRFAAFFKQHTPILYKGVGLTAIKVSDNLTIDEALAAILKSPVVCSITAHPYLPFGVEPKYQISFLIDGDERDNLLADYRKIRVESLLTQ